MADNYTHTFGAEKKSRNYSLFQTSQRRFFMLREGKGSIHDPSLAALPSTPIRLVCVPHLHMR